MKTYSDKLHHLTKGALSDIEELTPIDGITTPYGRLYRDFYSEIRLANQNENTGLKITELSNDDIFIIADLLKSIKKIV